MTSAQEAGFVPDDSVLDEVFERFGPINVEASIDSQFSHALRGEEEVFSSSYGETATGPADKSKRVVQIEDGRSTAILNTFNFSFGSDTQVNFSLSPHEEQKSSGLICSRCRENMDQEDLESCCILSETTAPVNKVQQIKEGSDGIELKETSTDPRISVVTEVQLTDISDDVGTCWRELGPKLKIAASKIHNLDDEYRSNRDKANALLIIWAQQEGSKATVGHLADVLESIGRKSIAEKLLGESKATLSSCVTDSEGELIHLTVKCKLDAEVDSELMLCEDAQGNKFIVKAINNSKGPWNSKEIQRNKEFLETQAAAAKDVRKTTEQRRQESLKRISSEVQELRQQLKRVKLDCNNAETNCAGISDPKENTSTKELLINDSKGSPQDVTQLLHSCEEQRTFCQGIYNALIKLIGEVGQPRDDNFMCIKQLCDFTKKVKDQENTFFPKIQRLNNLKQNLDQLQVAQLEKLEKWSRAQKEQVEGVEKLLSILFHQGKNQRSKTGDSSKSSSKPKSQSRSEIADVNKKSSISEPLCVQRMCLMDTGKKLKNEKKLLKRRSEPVIGAKSLHAFGRRRSKTGDSSKSSSKRKSQSLSEIADVNKKSNISEPLCVHRMCLMDTGKKLKNEKS